MTAAKTGAALPAHLLNRLPAEVIDALDRGQSVVPVGRDKKPLVKWKALQERQPTAGELSGWLHDFRSRIEGWARVTGRLSGVIVLDFDGTAVSRVTEWDLAPHVRTGSGGFHLILRYPGWYVKTINSRSSRRHSEVYPGVDVRGDGGYSLICGFNERGGYQWLRDPEPDDLAVLPRAVRAFFGLLEAPKPMAARTTPIRLPHNGDRPSMAYLVRRAIEEARVSGRNCGGLWLAVQLRDNGYSEVDAEVAGATYVGNLWPTNTKGDAEEYGEAEFRETLAGVYSGAARAPWARRVSWVDPSRQRIHQKTEWLPARSKEIAR